MDLSAAATTPTLLSGRYRLLEKLGAGRLAEVYHATDDSLQRSVLVHILREDLASQEALRRRFMEEISASARRSHSALLEIFDSGVMGERPFMVTEYATGKPLRERGVLTPEYALMYMRQVAGAVALCHAQGVPHPPITSSNILLVTDGHVKLLESWLMPPGEAPVDLAHYRAPELTEGAPPASTNAVYALGLLLYELVTGNRPVGGRDAAEIAQAHLTMRIPSVSRIHPPFYLPALDTLLRQATARLPEQRIADPARFAEALDSVWRASTGSTQRLVTQPAALPPQPQRPSPQSQPAAPSAPPQQARPQPSSWRGPFSSPEPPQHSLPRAVYAANQRRRSFARTTTSWFFVLLLLVAVAFGSYVGASYLADRLFAVQLPQIGLPALPDINLPNVGVDVPDWLNPIAQGEPLTVNIRDGLNLRDEPGLNTTIVDVIPNGTTVYKLEGPREVDGVSWVRVRVEYNNETREGWMSRTYLTQE
jgi:serine/threonine protein kinase